MGGWGAVSLVASELIFANEAIFEDEPRIRAISAGCASGVFLCLVTINFPSCFNFGKSERWELGPREVSRAWFEGSRGAEAWLGRGWLCGWM